jgi:hypothetical protein
MSRLRYGANDLFDLLPASSTMKIRHLLDGNTIQFDGHIAADRDTAVTNLTGLTTNVDYSAEKVTNGYTDTAINYHLNNVKDPMSLVFDESFGNMLKFKRGATSSYSQTANQGIWNDPTGDIITSFMTKVEELHNKYHEMYKYEKSTVPNVEYDFLQWGAGTMNPHTWIQGDETSRVNCITRMKQHDREILLAMGFTDDVIRVAQDNAVVWGYWGSAVYAPDIALGDGIFRYDGVHATTLSHRMSISYWLPVNHVGSFSAYWKEDINMDGNDNVIVYDKNGVEVGRRYPSKALLYITQGFNGVTDATVFATKVPGATVSGSSPAYIVKAETLVGNINVQWGTTVHKDPATHASVWRLPTNGDPVHAVKPIKSDYSAMPTYSATNPTIISGGRLWPVLGLHNPTGPSAYIPTNQYVAIIGPAHLEEISIKFAALAGSDDAGTFAIDLGAIPKVHVATTGLRLKAHLLQYIAENPDQQAATEEKIAQMDGYEDAELLGSLLGTKLTMPLYAARDSELGIKMASAGEDIYTKELGKGLTFKTAQNRINNLLPQYCFVAMRDDMVSHSLLLPAEVQAYSNSNDYIVTKHVDGTYWVATSYAKVEVVSITEYQALALIFSGLEAQETAASDTQLNIDTWRNSVLGDPDTEDSLMKPHQPDVHGGGWLDFSADVFIKHREIEVETLSGDAYKRACLVFKGPDMKQMEATIVDFYQSLALEPGGWA